MGDEKEKGSPWKSFERLVAKAIKAEKTTTGRVNLVGIIAVGVWGILSQEFFKNSVWVIVPVAFVISAYLSDRAKKR